MVTTCQIPGTTLTLGNTTCAFNLNGTATVAGTNLTLSCSTCTRTAAPCTVTQGTTTIKTLGLDEYTIGECAGVLVAYIIFCRLVAFLAVRYIKW